MEMLFTSVDTSSLISASLPERQQYIGDMYFKLQATKNTFKNEKKTCAAKEKIVKS